MLKFIRYIFIFLLICSGSYAFCATYYSQIDAIVSLFNSSDIVTDSSTSNSNPNQTHIPLNNYHLTTLTGGGELEAGIIFKPNHNFKLTSATEISYSLINQSFDAMINYPAGHSPQPVNSLDLAIDVVNIFITNNLYYRISNKWWGFFGASVGIASLDNNGTFEVESQGESQVSSTRINFSWQLALGVQYHINRYYALNARIFHTDDGKLPLGQYFKTGYSKGINLDSRNLSTNGFSFGLTLYA